jgi:hypothetical protein
MLFATTSTPCPLLAPLIDNYRYIISASRRPFPRWHTSSGDLVLNELVPVLALLDLLLRVLPRLDRGCSVANTVKREEVQPVRRGCYRPRARRSVSMRLHTRSAQVVRRLNSKTRGINGGVRLEIFVYTV